MRPFKAIIVLSVAALLGAAVVVVVPDAVPSLLAGLWERPETPALVTACWMAATIASITGKRALSDGALGWWTTTVAHIVGTVSNRIIPAGAGAGGAYFIALRRGGMTIVAASAMMVLWAAASGLANATGLLIGSLWVYAGEVSAAAALVLIAIVVWRTQGRRTGSANREPPGRDGVPAPEARAVPESADSAAVAEPCFESLTGVRTLGLDGSAVTRGDRVRQQVRALRESCADAIAIVRARPGRAWTAVAAQCVAMICLAIGFAIAATGFGVSVPITTAMAAYVAGTALSAAVPTPAGIGSADAALVGALVVVGASMSDAVPAVLIFRAVVLLAPVAVAAVIAIGWAARLKRGPRWSLPKRGKVGQQGEALVHP